MKLYVGLDVGLEETSLCIVDSEGVTVREVKVSTEPEAIRSELEGSADRLDRVGVVASSPGTACTANCSRPGSQSLLPKLVIYVFRFPPCATKPTGTMHVASRR